MGCAPTIIRPLMKKVGAGVHNGAAGRLTSQWYWRCLWDCKCSRRADTSNTQIQDRGRDATNRQQACNRYRYNSGYDKTAIVIIHYGKSIVDERRVANPYACYGW